MTSEVSRPGLKPIDAIVASAISNADPRVSAGGAAMLEYLESEDRRPAFTRFDDIAFFLMSRGLGSDVELVGAIYLFADGRFAGYEAFSPGTPTSVYAPHQVILRNAILCCAAKVFIFHTHPHGDSRPSDADIFSAQHFVSDFKAVGIEYDELVVGRDGVTSLRDAGHLDTPEPAPIIAQPTNPLIWAAWHLKRYATCILDLAGADLLLARWKRNVRAPNSKPAEMFGRPAELPPETFGP